MNQHLKTISDFIQQNESITAKEKASLIHALSDVEKEFKRTETELDKAEKVKQTTAIKLEETIVELEQKRKAVETQNRELEIEAALERVRSTSLAMHNSQDLSRVVYVVFTELVKLDAQLDRCLILIVNPHTMGITWYLTGKEGLLSNNGFLIPDNSHPSHKAYLDGWRTKRKKWHYHLTGEEKKRWDEYGFSHTGLAQLPEFIKADMAAVESIHLTISSDDFGCLIASSLSTLSAAHENIVDRFAYVFNQTYTRFLDLQKAEAQAREAQIQLALERLRAKTMAMHKSAELAEAAAVMWEQLTELGTSLWICGFNICSNYSDMVESWVSPHDSNLMDPMFIPYSVEYFTTVAYERWKNQGEMYTDIMDGDELQRSHKELLQHPSMAQARNYLIENNITMPTWVQRFAVPNKVGYLTLVVTKPFHEPDILVRFSKVFEQTYTRFLDLQKAEAQVREARIEAALERVRSQAMAMHQTEDLGKTIMVYYEQLDDLIDSTIVRCGAGLLNEGNTIAEMSTASKSPDGETYLVKGTIDMRGHPLLDNTYAHWLKQKEYSHVLRGNEIKEYYQFITNQVAIPENKGNDELYFYFPMFTEGSFYVVTNSEVPEDELQIFRRFSSVLSLTYRRFNDLQKAEAQAREAQIEAALERVRSRSMAMHRSEELSDVILTVSVQLQELGFRFGNVSFVLNTAAEDYDFWFSIPGQPHPHRIHVPYLDNAINNRAREARSKGLKFFADLIDPSESRAWHQHMFNHNQMDFLSAEAKAMVLNSGYARSVAIMHSIMLVVGNYASKPYSEDDNSIIRRFATVFEQTYTRFLDLQKAEAQAREAQIEAALERVRARTMAMYKSSELNEVAAVLFEQIRNLGGKLWGTGFALCNAEVGQDEFWFANELGVMPPVTIPNTEDEVHRAMYQAWKEKKDYLLSEKGGEQLAQHYLYLNSLPQIKAFFEPVLKAGHEFPNWQQWHAAYFSKGYLLIITVEQYPEPDILKRFAKVFEQTYTRFLDLQKAETQARQARIESALEKVRSRSLAMHHSFELEQVVGSLFDRLVELGFSFDGALIFTFDKERRNIQLWIATVHLSTPVLIHIPYDESIKNNAIIKDLWNAIEKGKHIFNMSYTRETKNEYFRYVARYNESKVPESVRKIQLEAESWTAYFVAEKNSIVGFDSWTGAITSIGEEDFQILLRFAKVFDQAYIRFLDLQKAEAREREAIKQASLDRVRAEIASMRTTADLNRITPLVWRELTTLGVPFFRCGVFIIDSEAKKIDSYLSNPEGESLAAWRSDYDIIPLFAESVKAWEKQQVFITEWTKQQFVEFSQRLVGQGLIRDVKRYQAGEVAPEHLSLHMIPFRQGMLYVGSAEKLNNDQIELAQSLASSFSVAYSRYEDFRQLERAKSEVEYTLSELKSTQTQLIHAEKMASLGELTAGIAHEIQNPLNFVNNFSEVSKEMIEELKAERLKVKAERDEGLEEELLNDINENLQKIHHHGQRASGIVKGMLQHSRTSSGQKESTNINSLADEYLRLAYHGFRAKDKSFNANFKTDLDQSLPHINVVSQDIGRVLLNLINNAFYVVSEKSKRGLKGYEPMVIVRTKRINHSIEIRVKDNGDGIPANVINKIFQPFFTTKPTGEGTGLGLSLSYDIITKGHNGSLEVDTTEGVGTEFIVQLPVV